MTARVILIEASPRLVATGATTTVRLAGGGAVAPYYYNGQHWRAGIVQLPSFITSLDFDGTDIGTGGIPQAAEIQWAPSTKADLAAMAQYFWPDAAVTVYVGPEGTMPPVRLVGKVLDGPVNEGTLKLQLSDPAASLKKPLLTDRYAGTGDLEGPAEWEGRIKRRIWGRVWNLSGEPIDKANNIYCFADPTRKLQAFSAVRDMGAPAAALSLLAWQGSVAATLAALRAAAAPQGGGVICPSIACVKWWTQPAGDLTADIKGEVGAAYVETTAGIAQSLVQALGGPAFAAGTIATADAARPAAVGWIARDENQQVSAMLDELLGNSSLMWLLDANGSIVLRPWAWGASTATARSQKVTRKKVLRPVKTRKLGYQRNETQMARGDIAAIVFATDVAYLDGTPIEDLKPAEAGADVTGNNTSADTNAVGGRPATTVNESIDINAAGIIAQALRQDDAQAVLEARTFVDGQPVNTVFETFRNEQTTENTAINSSLALLGAKTPDGTAWNLALDTVKVSPTKTLAARLEEIGVDNGEIAASVALLMNAVVGSGGGEARAVLKTDVNGNLAGIVLSSGTEYSRIGLVAGLTEIRDPDGNLLASFQEDADGAYIPNLKVDTLKVNTVQTVHLLANSVISPAFVQLASDISLTDGVEVDVISITLTKAVAESSIDIAANIRLESSDDIRGTFYLRRDGVLIDSVGIYMNGAGGTFRIVQPLQYFAAGVTAGSHTFKWSFVRSGGASTVLAKTGSNLKVQEIKR